MSNLLPREFFARPATAVAPELIGACLVRQFDSQRLVGVITETEAYQGMEDLGCHAHVGLTPRNAPLFGPPGHAYVYFTYGMHWMMNAVCDLEGTPSAVLIRAVYPLEGLEAMCENRPMLSKTPGWLNGPAKLAQAFAITKQQNRSDMCDPQSPILIESGYSFPKESVKTTGRIGLGQTPEPWFSIPWRWVIGYDDAKMLIQADHKSQNSFSDTL